MKEDVWYLVVERTEEAQGPPYIEELAAAFLGAIAVVSLSLLHCICVLCKYEVNGRGGGQI